MNQKFLIGFGKRIITPPLGARLYGYPYERPATAVHDDLRANVLAFGHGRATALAVSLDLCSVGYELCNHLKAELSKKTAIAEDQINISATHTHTGPTITTTVAWGVADNAYIDQILIPNLLEAAVDAVQNVQEALLGVGTTQSRVGINRRQLGENGCVYLGQNPYGLYDPTMTVLSFVSPEKKPIVTLVHYGAHPTSAGGVTEISRDWPGIMIDRLETETGAPAVFFNGAEGDVGPRLSNGSTAAGLSYMVEIGCVAAIDAVGAYKSIKSHSEVCFKTITDTISIPYQPFPALDEAEAMLEEMGDPANLIEMQLMRYETLKERIRIMKAGETIKTQFEMLQTLFAFNDVVLVPFPFEMFTEITQRLQHYSPVTHTLGICNTNGAYAYLPSRDQLSRGGYEVSQFLYHEIFALVENADDHIIRENLRLIRALAV